MDTHDLSEVDIRVLRTNTLSDGQFSNVLRLFDTSYRQANHAYLKRSLDKLPYIALAMHKDALAGFAIGDTVLAKLPRLSDSQAVALAGISCIAPEFRRRGLFFELEKAACFESGILIPGLRFLQCGRMAHPVSFRVMRKDPSVIPKLGVPLSEWHKEIGLRVADIYGVSINPDTFVVIGDGKPIGFPILEYEVTDEEWRLFDSVDRNRGDSLLAMSWTPDAPEGW